MSGFSARRVVLQAGLHAAVDAVLPVWDGGAELLESRWTELESEAAAQKMLPMLERFAAHRLGRVPNGGGGTRICAELSTQLLRHAEAVVTDLRAAGVECMLIKGADLQLGVYGDGLPRMMCDCDLLVKPGDVPRVRETFEGLGYVQGVFDLPRAAVRAFGVAERAEIESGNFELALFLKLAKVEGLQSDGELISRHFGTHVAVVGRDLYAAIGFDVHTNLSDGIALADLWRGDRETILPGGLAVPALAPEELLWFLAGRAYVETVLHGRRAMRYFVDVVAVLRRFAEEVDWARVLYAAEKYDLWMPLFYVLHHAREVAPASVPAAVLERLRPTDANRDRDWGDVLPRMLGETCLGRLWVETAAGAAEGDGEGGCKA